MHDFPNEKEGDENKTKTMLNLEILVFYMTKGTTTTQKDYLTPKN